MPSVTLEPHLLSPYATGVEGPKGTNGLTNCAATKKTSMHTLQLMIDLDADRGRMLGSVCPMVLYHCIAHW